ncbi:uncharacterized protein Tco025E_08122 [Trypanosoma conorhini]|uniref:Uncharacterized protein n=1 Tax=Trypanosoma conorhini TaxID=83891 RepID=A0A422NE23_9TRYP|nr:uncharacterized protein Tco025E_08122 [Trypanosoma conorhini]RNF03737.1 hypothetical protein Tco025E_08122 [Trypanosoma conorhini]
MRGQFTRQPLDVGDKTNADPATGEDQKSAAPYHSPFGGYNYYPTTLFKRDALPGPSPAEEPSLKNASPPGYGADFGGGNGRTSSWGAPHIKVHRDTAPRIAPLMDRYKRRDSGLTRKSLEGDMSQDLHEGPGASVSAALASSGPLKGSTRADIMPCAGTVGRKGKRNISSAEIATEPIELRRCRTQQSRRMTASCPPALNQDSPTSNGQRIIHVEKKNGETNADAAAPCRDAHCIHSRQTILDYVDLQRDLRVCHATLRDQDTELSELRSQLSVLQAERAELESRFQIELQGIESRYAEELAKEREEQMEWQKRALSEQLATYERDREELERLRMALEQERLNHDHTRSELDAAQEMCLALKHQLETSQLVAAASASPLRRKDSAAGKTREHFLPDAHSPTSTLMTPTPTPRRQPPPVPASREDAEYISGAAASTFPLVRGKSQPSRPCREERPTEQGPVGNVTATSTINVSDPSVALSAVPDMDLDEAHSFLVRQAEDEHLAKRAMPWGSEECDEGTQRETEEYTEREGGHSSCATRDTTLPAASVQRTGILAYDALSCGRSSTEALSEAALALQPLPPEAFDQLAGREADLCRELLRIILDKENQIAELTAARMQPGEETKLSFLSE